MRFGKFLAGATALSLLWGCAPAPNDPTATTSIAALNRADADPALWLVEDADTKIYLFGTVHLLKPDLIWFDDAVADAFAQSDTLMLEMVEPPMAEMQKIVMAKGIDASGAKLRDKLTDEQRAKYDKVLTDTGMPVGALDRLQPWMAAVTLSLAPMQKLGFDQNKGVERSLTGIAREKGKTVEGFETAEQQLSFFSDMPQVQQIGYLMSVIDGMPEYQSMMGRMETNWATGDVEALNTLLNESMAGMPEVSKVLLADRNARWAEWIDTRMAKPGTVFVAVGAGHLAGGDSVQAMLKGRKLNAKRIDY